MLWIYTWITHFNMYVSNVYYSTDITTVKFDLNYSRIKMYE